MTTTGEREQRVIAIPANGPMERIIAGAGLAVGRPVVVLIGGAAKLDNSVADMRGLIRDGVIATAQAEGATVIDGGTDSGVMAIAGQARKELGATVPLVGVAPIAKVDYPGAATAKGTTRLEPNHTHVLLAPGDEWGSESAWLIHAARILGRNRSIVIVLVDGGPLALQEAMAGAAQGWPLITIAGTGRTADVLASYSAGIDGGASPASGRRGTIHTVEASAGAAALADLLRGLLRGQRPVAVPRKGSPTPDRLDFPALYSATANASRRGQRNFKRLSASELSLTLLALGIGLVASVVVAASTLPVEIREALDAGIVVTVAVFFLLALLVKFLIRSSTFDDDWFNGRAIAETIKSTSWRYMMRVPPFNNADADDQLTGELASLLDASAGLRHAVEGLPPDAQQITPSMRAAHDLDFDGRRQFYVKRRLIEQAHWYRRRSAQHHRSATRWFWAAIVFQVLAVVSALLALAAVAAHQPPDLEAPFIRAMGLLASLAIAVTAWTQLGRDDELARTYAVALQELLLIAGAAERAKTDEVFAAVVRDGEGAIGRETGAWVAKRTERRESIEFGHGD